MITCKQIERTYHKLTMPIVKCLYLTAVLKVLDDESRYPMPWMIGELLCMQKYYEVRKRAIHILTVKYDYEQILNDPFSVEKAEVSELPLRPLKQKEIAVYLGCSIRHVARLQAGGIIPKGATMQDVQGYLTGLTKRDPINNMETVEQILEKYKKGS